MKRISFSLWVPLLFVALLFSCEKESEKSELYIPGYNGSTGEQVTWDGGETAFEIRCNTDWSIEILSGESGSILLNDAKQGVFNQCDWLRVYPQHGNGNATINVSVDENSDIWSRDAIIVIRTNDGRCTENIWFVQDGTQLSGWDSFEVFPLDKRIFNGRAHDIDSLYVISPHGSEIYGPSWIEAKINNTDWKPLSESTPRSIGGLGVIALRTAQDNTSEDNLTGFIRVTDTFGTDYVDIDVTQLGCYQVRADKVTTTADGIACNWRYGCDVKSFYVEVFEGSPAISDLRWEKTRKWQKFDAFDDLVVGWSGLKEQTRYEIVAVGVDNYDNHSNHLTSAGVTTGSSINQPRALITDVDYFATLWQWNTVMNEHADSYYQWISTDSSIDELPDSWIKWVFLNNMDEFDEQTESETWTFAYKGQIYIATMALDNTGYPSSVIDRYGVNSTTKRAALNRRNVGKRIGDLKRSTSFVSIIK